MPDLIRIVDLEVWSHIGVPELERANAQRLLVSLEMTIDSFAHAASTDNIAWTINYADVVKQVQHLAAKRPRKLIETLAEELAADLFKVFPIRTVGIEIKKFVIPAANHVSVTIGRTREREWRP